MYVEPNAVNTNVIYVILVGLVGGKKMTVFKKIKTFDIDEMSKFINLITEGHETLEDFYCGQICQCSNDFECSLYPLGCLLHNEPVEAIKEIMNMNYDDFRRRFNG